MEDVNENNNKQVFSIKTMVDASQIAYLSFLEKSKRDLESQNKKGPFTIKELICNVIDYEAVKKDYYQTTGENPENAKFKDLLLYSDIEPEDMARIERLNNNAFDYKVIDITDLNEQTGFYACTIETDSDKAIVAFRGSEDCKKPNNLIKDWIEADFGLLNSTETEQQNLAETYADIIANKVEQYQDIGVTGHSLGGNLAAHFTINSAKSGREKLYAKIKQCDDLDGPGFSEKYTSNSENVKLCDKVLKEDNKITHYKWSAVGGLLYELPFEKVKYLACDETQHNEPDKDSLAYKILGRHATSSLIFDKFGNAKEGKQDRLSKILGTFSRGLDTSMKFLEKHLLPVIKGISGLILKNPKTREGKAIEGGNLFFEKFIDDKRIANNEEKKGIVSNIISNIGNIIQNEKQEIEHEITFEELKEIETKVNEKENNENKKEFLNAIKSWKITSNDFNNLINELVLGNERVVDSGNVR